MYARIGENGPLFYALLHVWLLIARPTDFAVRFASVAAGVLTVPLVYALGAELFGRAAGVSAAALLGADPYHLWYSQEAKMYAAVALVAALSVWLLVDALRSTGWGKWIAWLAVLGAGFYLHFFVALLIVAEAAAVTGKTRLIGNERPFRTMWRTLADALEVGCKDPSDARVRMPDNY